MKPRGLKFICVKPDSPITIQQHRCMLPRSKGYGWVGVKSRSRACAKCKSRTLTVHAHTDTPAPAPCAAPVKPTWAAAPALSHLNGNGGQGPPSARGLSWARSQRLLEMPHAYWHRRMALERASGWLHLIPCCCRQLCCNLFAQNWSDQDFNGSWCTTLWKQASWISVSNN